jgi:Ca2+-binding EF-hand superfamily protein
MGNCACGKNGEKEENQKIKISEEQILNLLANTSFSREEILNWHDGFIVSISYEYKIFSNDYRYLYFLQKDCPSGKLDKKKFIEVYKVFYPQGKADKFCSHVFKVFDTDGSGLIDFTEFLVAISVTAQGDARKKLSLAFKMYDVDKNGTVDKREMQKIIEAIYDLLGEELKRGENSPAERVKMIMNKLDKDNSGTLSENEFVEGT